MSCHPVGIEKGGAVGSAFPNRTAMKLQFILNGIFRAAIRSEPELSTLVRCLAQKGEAKLGFT